MGTAEADIAVKGKTKRILAFDLMRGYFLLVIMIDHVELFPNGWDIFTGKGRLWASAAEGFFFLSGLLIGMIYKRRLQLGMKFIFRKMWRRAFQLYIVGTALTFVFLEWAELAHRTNLKDNLPSPFPWGQYLERIFLTHYTYGWADFLVHFAVLMLIAPFVFYLVARRKWWLALTGIVIAWIFRGQSFNLAWQLIFNTGIIVGFYWQEIGKKYDQLKAVHKRRIKQTVAAIAAGTFLISYASVYILSLLNHVYGSLTPWLRHVTFTWNNYNADIWIYADKWTMGWLRIILFFLWFTAFYWLIKRYDLAINRWTRGLLELLGRNSLLVYTAHAFIVFILKIYFIPAHTDFVGNFLFTALGAAALILITAAYKRIMSSVKTNRLLKMPEPTLFVNKLRELLRS